MTQPAKVQEPSMEEILASIRRIIADDEAKPAVEKPSSPAAAAKPEKTASPAPPSKAPVMNNIPPSAIPAAQAAAAKAAPPVKPAPPPAPPPAAAAVSHSQDHIDAMLARPRREGVFGWWGAGLGGGTTRSENRAGPARGRGVRTHRRDGGAGAAAFV